MVPSWPLAPLPAQVDKTSPSHFFPNRDSQRHSHGVRRCLQRALVCRGLPLYPARKLSRRPIAVPGEPSPHSGHCTRHSSFPAQKADKISPIKRPETLPFPQLAAVIAPCPIRAQYCHVVCWAHQWRWKLEHLSLQQGETGPHLYGVSC